MEKLDLTGIPGSSFWCDKRVLLTGHSGFKGAWLTLWLHCLGARVTGVSLPPMTTPNLYQAAAIDGLCQSCFCDIRDGAGLAECLQTVQPEIVFHLAAQPLVRAGYREPRVTIETNVMGTVHVLEALRSLDNVRVAVMVTTDKVYRGTESPRQHQEDDALGGHDPYSASKAASEIVIESYRDAFLSMRGVGIASARAGNVIGGGDWSEDRLIPDAIRAWQFGRTLDVRRPEAVRPWQHVLEPLAGYLALAECLWMRPALAGSYNFGPESGDAVTVRDLVEMARAAYGTGDVCYGTANEGPHEAACLALDSAKAGNVLGIAPTLTLVQAVQQTMVWYRAHNNGADARELCSAEISDYENRVRRFKGADARPGLPIRRMQTAN
jgi:CDP-glucose 4,6-dehydratase